MTAPLCGFCSKRSAAPSPSNSVSCEMAPVLLLKEGGSKWGYAMKTKIAAAVLFAACMTLIPRPAEATVSVSITFFHQELAPYGRWVYTPAYGEVWYPTAVAAGWAPYVDGEWVYTDCGWTWVSYDPFSDPYHYGTWVWVDPYGWCWEPGYVWGPAWVTWAWTDTYV